MTEFKNSEQEIFLFRRRVLAVAVFVLLCFVVLLARLVWLQILRRDSFALQAEENRVLGVPLVPSRGLILDRNGVVLAQNYSAYTLEVTPSKIETDMDVLIDQLSQLVVIEPKHRRQFRKLVAESKSFESLPIRSRLSDEEVARFTAQRFRFPGVDVQARLFRHYPLGESASHVVGYIGRINQREEDALEDSEDEANYNGTNYIGKEGLEKSYEKLLHGKTGYEQVEVTASGRAVRSLARSPAQSGSNLILSIDIELQKVVEEAFGDRRGALVAIEPSTGDVLAFVSKPTYDPNLFVEGIDQQSWDELNGSPDKPLLNRPLLSAYPPGSTYKPFMGLAGLELGKRTPATAIADPGYFYLGNHRFNDDRVGGHGIVDLYKSIVLSCNTYYYTLANELGVDAIHDFMQPFGFGQKTGIDLDNERSGLLPSTEWRRRSSKKAVLQKWNAGDTISLGNGQGFNTFTPLQMAHAVATLANDGVVMKPHLVKLVEDPATRRRTEVVSKESARIPLKPENLAAVKQAMIGVTREGTSRAVFANAEYVSAGKTGTAQVYTVKANEKYDAKRLPERMRDHSWYTSFAPADRPRIAIAVIVENAGKGAEAAAPIVRKALDYYLLGKKPAVDQKVAPVVTIATASNIDEAVPD